MLATLSGSNVWLNLDFIPGYWQFPLSPESQECQSFHTPFGVYTPKQVMHGSKKSCAYVQSSMEAIFGHLGILIYVDDLLGYAQDSGELINNLRVVFNLCLEKVPRMNPKNCYLVDYEVQFCS